MIKPHNLRFRSSGPDDALNAADGLTGQAVIGAGDGVLTFGANGSTGSIGPTGPTGSAGPTGPTGATGPQTSAIVRDVFTFPTIAASTISSFTFAANVATTSIMEVYASVPDVDLQILSVVQLDNVVAQVTVNNLGAAINPIAGSFIGIPANA